MKVVTGSLLLLILSTCILSQPDAGAMIPQLNSNHGQPDRGSSPNKPLNHQSIEASSHGFGSHDPSPSLDSIQKSVGLSSSASDVIKASTVVFAIRSVLDPGTKSTNSKPRKILSLKNQNIPPTLGYPSRRSEGNRIPTRQMFSPDLSTSTVQSYRFQSNNGRLKRETPPINCSSLFLANSMTEIMKDCENATQIKGYYSQDPSISISKFDYDLFMDSKKSIELPLFLMRSSAKTLMGKNVEKLFRVSVEKNPFLEIVSFPVASEVSSITITDNPKLKFVDLRNVTETGFYLTNCSSEANEFEIKIDALEKSWRINFYQMHKLKNVSFPNLLFTESLFLTYNEELVEIHLPLINAVASSIHISSNPKLSKFDVPELVQLGRRSSIYFEKNEKLEEISFPKLLTINMSDINIKGNPVLKQLSFPNLATLTISERLNITNNSRLESVVLSSGSLNLTVASDAKFEISRNPSLTKIDFGTFDDAMNISNVKIYGNRNLARSAIKMPSCEENCYIQEDNECVFDKPINDLSELDGCKNVFGNLTIIGSKTGKTNSTLKSIQKNIRLIDVDFSTEQIHFLRNTTIGGDFEVITCGPRSIYANITRSVKGNVTFSNGASCEGFCTAEDLVLLKRNNCEIVSGLIQMRWEPYTAADVENFKMVKQLIGRIDLENVFPDGNLTDLLEFTNLESIETSEGGISIRLNSNQYMNRLPFPKLTAVNTPNKYMAEISYNAFEFPMKKLFEWEANLTKSIITEDEMFPYLPGPQLVTKLIEIDEDELHFDEYDQKSASSFAVLPLILLFLMHIMI